MPCLGTTETIQRIGLLDLTSITERTIPVTGNPFNITVAFWPRYWAQRQRRASIRSVISIVCMHHQWSRYAKEFPDNPQDIEQPLTMIAIRFGMRPRVRRDLPLARQPDHMRAQRPHRRRPSNARRTCIGMNIAPDADKVSPARL